MTEVRKSRYCASSYVGSVEGVESKMDPSTSKKEKDVGYLPLGPIHLDEPSLL